MAVALVGGLLGVLLLLLAVPGVVSGFYASIARGVIWEVEQKHPVSAARLAEGVAALAQSNRWEPSAERMSMQAFLMVRQAEKSVTDVERDRLLLEARSVTEDALALGPIQPHAWTMLAVLRQQAGDLEGAVQAMRLSFLSGTVVPPLMVSRLETALTLRAWMNADTLDLLRRQIRLVWVLSPQDIATISADPVLGVLVREALDDLNEEEISHFLNLHSNKTLPGNQTQ